MYGNSLEVAEAVEALNGKMEDDVKEIVLEIVSHILKLAKFGDDISENKRHALECIKSGTAYKKFLQLVEKQGGCIEYLSNIPKSKYIVPVKAKASGFIFELNATQIGEASLKLGAGRVKKEDKIDYLAGIVLNKKIGDRVEIGEVLAYIHTKDEGKIEEAKDDIEGAYKIIKNAPNKYEHILDVI